MKSAPVRPAVDYLITGGGGFVGAALAEALLARGQSVCCLDTGGFWRLDHLRDHSGLELVEGDACDPDTVESLVARAGAVLHLAAVVGVDRYVSEPGKVLDVNVGGTRLVAERCLKHDRPLLFTSSSEAYGKTPLDLDEDADTTLGRTSNIRWTYAVSKYAAEQYLHAFGRAGLRFAVVRYFNVYGPLMDRPGEGRVISKFLGCLQRGEPLPLVDGGQAVRAFCHIDDGVRGTISLLDALMAGQGVAGRCFNVGRAEPVTMAELARRMVRLAAHAPGTTTVSGRQFFGPGFEEIPRRVPRLDALREATGFVAQVELEEGLKRTMAHWHLLAPAPAAAADDPKLALIAPKIEPDASLVAALLTSLQSGAVTNHGPVLQAFEEELGAFLGATPPVVVSSGSAALSLVAAALKRRGKAVLPAFTYIATLNAVVHAGLEPIFCDIREDDFTMDAECLRRILQRHADVSLVLPVNVYGVHPDLDAICAQAAEHGADVLYDNAHGMGTMVSGRSLPGGPRAQVFSLHGTKICPAVEGGLVASEDGELLEALRRLRAHGLHVDDLLRSTPGFNLKMSELHAAVGRHSLRGLPDAVARRRRYASRLRASLSKQHPEHFVAQTTPSNQLSNFQFLAFLWQHPDRVPVPALIEALGERGVQGRRFFWPPLHDLAQWRGAFDLPVTDRVCERLLCLPIHNRMSEADLRRIEAAVEGAVAAVLG